MNECAGIIMRAATEAVENSRQAIDVKRKRPGNPGPSKLM
jgi:hypothetical protein